MQGKVYVSVSVISVELENCKVNGGRVSKKGLYLSSLYSLGCLDTATV